MTITDMLRKQNELKGQRAALLQDASTAIDEKNMDTYKAKMSEAAALVPEIDNLQNLINECARYNENSKPTVVVGTPAAENKTLKDMLASNEYINAFCMAIRQGIAPKTAGDSDEGRLLLNALTESGGTPQGADGGFLVPVDMETKINEVRREEIALASLFTAENVTTNTGFRVYDTAPTKGFTKVAEMGTIPQDDQPAFSRINYSVEDYALIVPISNDLLADNNAGLMAYLARWGGKKSVITENINLLALLNTLTGTALTSGKEIDEIKSVLNKTLDPAIARLADIVTNQSGFDVLDHLKDADGRYLLQPNPTDPTKMMLKGRNIMMVPDALIPNDETNGAPVYIGAFKQFGALMRRQPMEFATTNIGGNAWHTNSTEGRFIMRMDEMLLDKDAAVLRYIPLA